MKPVIRMDLPVRKQNRLQNFDYSQNGAYFITICTKERKRILCDIVGDDAHIVPKKYGRIVEKYIRNVPEIKKYIIMPDHIHMIIEIDNGTIMEDAFAVRESHCEDTQREVFVKLPHEKKVESIVRSLKVLTTKEIGLSVFQRSYYDHVIRNKQDYREIWEYIENNPRKWVLQRKNFE